MDNKPYTLELLKDGICQLGILPDDTLLIHSSMKSIGIVEGEADGVLDAFSEYLKDGLLLFPTHTWQVWNNPDDVFEVLHEPSCVGVLTELFRKRPGVIRSWHPTHSIAGLGRDAAVFLAGEERTRSPCPREGCWGRLYDRDAKILFLGASLKTNTYLHSVEEWYEIPNRLSSEPTPFTIRTPELEMIPCPQFRHSSSFGDVSKNYDKIEAMLLREGVAVEGRIGDARSICVSAVKLADRVGELLKQIPHLFNDGTSLDQLIFR